jgi:hypothetical protein
VKTFRRQRQQYLFAGLLGIIALLNVLFFLILYRPARAEYFGLQDSIHKTRAEVQARRGKIDRLEKLSGQLETSAQDKKRLFTKHFIPRVPGWSQIVPQLEEMVQSANVRNVRKAYTIDDTPQFGLSSVKITLPVAGTYSNVVNFIRELEEANTFFIINSIDVRGSTNTSSGGQDIAMNLNLETFFYK